MTFDFANPIFHPGLNLTIRAGDAFMNHPEIKPGATVQLRCPGRALDCGPALIVATLYYDTVADIPRDLLRFEHMPSCRDDRDELERQLVIHYGSDYGPGVTLIFFHYPFVSP